MKMQNETTMERYYRHKKVVDREMKKEYPFWKLIFKGKEQFNRIVQKMIEEKRSAGE